ncbi:MAG: hypothetical protein IAE87_07695 [Rhodobacteraceae bacterium]|jgi:hypothetical protein|nr:hypothetical protein [Paracoccaceae bacterium]
MKDRSDPVLAADALAEAAANLLVGCGGFAAGDEVVICREDPAHGWYDGRLAATVAGVADALGMRARVYDVPAPGLLPDADTAELLASASNIVFFARLGDQGRFGPSGGLGRRVMVYARDLAALASSFGRMPHAAMLAFKVAMDEILFSAEEIVITCPAGTRIAGQVPAAARRHKPQDVTVRRFPLGVPAPVPAAGFSGGVVLTDALTPTGNRTYDPPVLFLTAPVVAWVESGRIVGFEGAQADVAAIDAHYRHLADLFGITPDVVHSWHGGIHPGCRFYPARGTDRDLWSNTVFSSPRLLHFHTCGTEAPGEISWNLVDPTVTVDGTVLLDRGRLFPGRFAALAGVIAANADLQALFGAGG